MSSIGFTDTGSGDGYRGVFTSASFSSDGTLLVRQGCCTLSWVDILRLS